MSQKCEHCRGPVYSYPGKRKKRFCSNACRSAANRIKRQGSSPPRTTAEMWTLLTKIAADCERIQNSMDEIEKRFLREYFRASQRRA